MPSATRAVPAWGLLCSCLLLVCAQTVRAEDPAADPLPAAGSCEPIYAAGYDPRLFDFVETRKAVDFAPLQGKRIAHIEILTLPVFNTDDPRENNALYRGVNKLHVNTREKTISKQLLVHVDGTVDADRIHESERILRTANYLYDAMILPSRICGDTVDLLVVVRDIWTLQPAASFSRSGGANSTSIGISDDNILGYGHGLSVSWDKDPFRSGIVFGYNGKNLFDGHTNLHLDYTKNNDGQASGFSLARPFYALDTRWSAGASIYNDKRRETIASGGVTSNIYDHDLHQAELFFGLSAGLRDNVTQRWRIGITRDDNTYYNQDTTYVTPLPADRLLTYPWVEFESIENSFWTTSNLSQLFRNEDVNTGRTFRVRVGSTSSMLGSNTDELTAELEFNNTVSFGNHHLLQNHLTADVHWNEKTRTFAETLYGYLANYDYFIDENDRWHALLSVDAGENLSAETELTAGGDSHLRGYPNQWQRGDRRVVANIERRHFFDAHPLHLFRLGAAAFVETGKAWDSTGTIVQSDRVLSDIGIGLRINSSKARPSHVIHVDVAVPLSDRGSIGSYQWSVHSESTF